MAIDPASLKCLLEVAVIRFIINSLTAELIDANQPIIVTNKQASLLGLGIYRQQQCKIMS